MQHARRLPLAIFLSAATFLAACGSDSVGIGAPTTLPAADVTTTAAATETTTDITTGTDAPDPSGDISSFSDVQPAVLQLEGAGTFREPAGGTETVGWAGSGFFISADGLAVTNNHVVSGAATLEVFAGGDRDKSWNAKVIGASECNDLALIQVDVDEPVPFLEWTSADVKPGLEIYLAGFPLGDPDYTLVRGIISKKTKRDNALSSVDEALQYDAQSQPGNSGGPVIDTDGDVVAVHYQSNSQTNTSQFFGIDANLAEKVVDELRNGDFEAIGINSHAIVDEESGVAGVWVSGVAAGTAASKVGLLPGDIITSLNGLPVGQDGTLGAYCDVLRTSGTEPMAIQVLRFDSGEILTGELYGEKKLEVSQLLVSDDIPEDLPVSEAYTYEEVIDDTGQILIEVPVEWAQRQTQGQTLSDGDHAAIVAAPDLDGFLTTDTATGILVAGFLGEDWSAVLDAYEGQLNCTEAGDVQDVDNGYLAGAGVVYSGCGDTGGSTGVVVLGTPDGGAAILLIAQLNTDSDFDALNRAVASLIYVPAF